VTRGEIVEKYRKYLYGVSTYYKEPLPFVRGEGKWLEDPDGRRYLVLGAQPYEALSQVTARARQSILDSRTNPDA